MIQHSEQASYSAIDLRRISDRFLAHSSQQGGALLQELPTARVSPPQKNADRSAILSYRWDYHPQLHVSRNLEVAIRQSKLLGLDYLLLDRLSIDQGLAGEQLAQAIIAYSELYETLPVIAAYDEVGVDKFYLTIRRPWILREIRALRANPTKVCYVGHIPTQGARSEAGFTYLGGEKYVFEHGLYSVWGTTFARSILYLLDGQVTMTSISDLRYIMPEHREVLEVAFTSMTRNDYLLTAAILAQVFATDELHIGDTGNSSYAPRAYLLNADQDIWTSSFVRYARGDESVVHSETSTDILLDSNKVATWAYYENRYTSNSHSKLIPEPNAERTMFRSLGLSETDYLRYKSREEERRRISGTIDRKESRLRVQVVLMETKQPGLG